MVVPTGLSINYKSLLVSSATATYVLDQMERMVEWCFKLEVPKMCQHQQKILIFLPIAIITSVCCFSQSKVKVILVKQLYLSGPT